MQTKIKGREKKWLDHLKPFPSTLWKDFYWFGEPLIWQCGGKIETIQVWKEHEGFEKISKMSKKIWKLILVSRWGHTVALLSD